MVAPNSKPNKKLVSEALKGSRIAFEELYDLYFEKIYRFVYYRVSHREAAEDLVSETFMKAWDAVAEVRDPEAFTGWLFKIARNLVIDYYRSRKTDTDLTELENVLAYEDNVIDKTDVSFQQQKFLEALKKLTPTQQLVIKLKFLDELENREIAEILDKNEGAIRVIQHRAILELKELINENDNGRV